MSPRAYPVTNVSPINKRLSHDVSNAFPIANELETHSNEERTSLFFAQRV